MLSKNFETDNSSYVKIGVNIALIENSKVLLTRREDYEVWCLPGGAVNENESVVDAATREMYEETGLKVKIDRLCGIFYQSLNLHNIVFTATLLPHQDTLKPNPSEVIECKFFDQENLPEDIMWWYRLRILRAFEGAIGEVWFQDVDSPFVGFSRKEIYELRDTHQGSRKEFYEIYLNRIGPRGEERHL